MRRLTPLIAAALAAGGLASTTAPAGASSIVYLKAGNVWLTSPDGRTGYQLTEGGDWNSPSQADDGTIVAQRAQTIYRLARNGTTLSTLKAVGGDQQNLPGLSDKDHPRKIIGPYDPKVSPDGTQIAYWFYVEDLDKAEGTHQIVPWATTTASDHFTGGADQALRTGKHPSWMGSGRLLVAHPFADAGDQISTWVPGGDWHNEQWWFSNYNAILDDAELSPDGTRLVAVAATHGAASTPNTLWFWNLAGPAFTGAPPYSNPQPAEDKPLAPELMCGNEHAGQVREPTWAPDGSAIAFEDGDGVWIEQVPGRFDACGDDMAERLAIPGGRDPDWGPADVDPSQAPRLGGLPAAPSPAGTAPQAGRGGSGPRALVQRVRGTVAGRAGRRSLRIALELTAPATVRVQLRRGRRVLRRAQWTVPAGSAVRSLTLGGVHRGRYRLVVTAAPRGGGASQTVNSAVRILR